MGFQHFSCFHIFSLDRSLENWSGWSNLRGFRHRIFQPSTFSVNNQQRWWILAFQVGWVPPATQRFSAVYDWNSSHPWNAKFYIRTPKDILWLWLEISFLGFLRLLCPCCDLTFTVCLQSVSSILDVLQNEQLQWWLDCSLWSVWIY